VIRGECHGVLGKAIGGFAEISGTRAAFIYISGDGTETTAIPKTVS
jgi:hypothetical protein